jgi:glycosyltransferase involved in cell wall biosynthesis
LARVLISTLAPGLGGVDAMTRFVVRSLVARGLEPVIAHYAPYRVSPALSAPSFRLLRGRPGWRRDTTYGGLETYAMGAWLPELEFTHNWATSHWRRIMDSCDAFVAVSGNVLTATPFFQTRRPYLAWVASDWQGDRKDRARRFPLLRRLLDTLLIAPVIGRLERRLLRAGNILALSEYTARMLTEVAGPAIRKARLPLTVDTAMFLPEAGAIIPGRLGFAGRFNDPRKNVGLFLKTIARLRDTGHDVTAILMGDAPSAAVLQLAADLELGPHITFESGSSLAQMRNSIQTLDVFVLPSHQEGLCVSALEAMACGVPVVSTRCGGPEEFVLPGVTGELVASDPGPMADAIARIITDRELRSGMSQSARRIVQERYAAEPAEAVFLRELDATFPNLSRN